MLTTSSANYDFFKLIFELSLTELPPLCSTTMLLLIKIVPFFIIVCLHKSISSKYKKILVKKIVLNFLIFKNIANPFILFNFDHFIFIISISKFLIGTYNPKVTIFGCGLKKVFNCVLVNLVSGFKIKAYFVLTFDKANY